MTFDDISDLFVPYYFRHMISQLNPSDRLVRLDRLSKADGTFR
jgi:hypothetical protein